MSIFYDGNGGTVHVQVTGKGCRQLEQRGVLDNSCPEIGYVGGWRGFFEDLLEHGCRFARVDFAFDDMTGLLDLDEIKESLEEGYFTGKAHKSSEISQRGRRQEVTGLGFLVGSRQSQMCARIYDKHLEQAAQHKPSPEHWVRVELEAKQERAAALVHRYVQVGEQAVADALYSWLDFKEPDPFNQNKARWDTCSWWGKFLNNPTKISTRRS